jgi:ferric-dicitrate binding protein FerR (iron transport regulator)
MDAETSPNSKHSFEELVVRYWDGALSARELAELNAALAAQPELRARFNDLCLQKLAIVEELRAAQALEPVPEVRRLPNRRRWLIGSAAAAAGLVAAAGLWALRGRPSRTDDSGDTFVAQVEDIAGTVYVTGPGNEEHALAPNESLKVGQAIATGDVSSSARLRCADGTYIVLGENTSATLLDRTVDKIQLERGTLAAAVPSRPKDRPLHIVTPGNTEVLARGSKLWLECSQTETRVVHGPDPAAPDAGAVRLKRLSDGQSVRIPPGHRAVAQQTGDLRSEVQLKTPDTYHCDFNNGLPAGWEVGQLVFDDLPEGSKGAVRAMPSQGKNGKIFNKVLSNKDWTNGLFTIHEDTWLHVTFRVDKPGFFHCLVVARDPDATRRLCVVLESPTSLFERRQARQWHTAHLPFAQFRPTQPENQLEKPLIAFIVVFDSQAVDRGLTVERFWITRGPEAQRT